MRLSNLLAFAGAALFATPAAADTIAITVTIPRLSVAEYHRPYVAVWLEQPGSRTIQTLAVWYDHDMRKDEGRKWLSDLRSWWRKGGRTASLDGVSGATRAPGPQRLTVSEADLKELKAGEYQLVVEAARETGGRELVRVPITLGSGKPTSASAKGSHELGLVSATVKP